MLESKRLTIIPPNKELIEAELDSPLKLAAKLNTIIPNDWPPENLIDAKPWFMEKLYEDNSNAEWLNWYVVEKEINSLIGSIGFLGKPNSKGEAEIGYSILPAFRKNGYAKEAVKMITEWAIENEEIRLLIAKTLPENLASQKVLLWNNFVRESQPGENGEIIFFKTKESISENKKIL